MNGVMTNRARNRALLARQHLIERSAMSVEQMVEHLVGMQAQEPRDPYVALWSRVKDFEPHALERLLLDRGVVRLPVMRTTLHLVTARDTLVLWPMSQPILARVFNSTAWGKALRAENADLDAIVDEGAALLAERPQTSSELKAALAERFPGHDPAAMTQAVHYRAPVVQVPPRGMWTQSGRATWTTLEAWLGAAPAVVRDTEIDQIVLRYIGAFGPANAADITTWSGLTQTRTILDRLRPQLVVFHDERGRELFDLPDAPRPDPDTPVPPRFFPIYDNLGLSHKDRSHVTPDLPLGTLDGWIGTFSVDGYLRGQWDVVQARDEAVAEIAPLAELSPTEAAAVEAEALGLLRMRAPNAERREVRFGSLSRWARTGGRPPGAG